MPDKPLILIGVCTCERPQPLRRLLLSLTKLNLPKKHRLALLIVENAAVDSVSDIIAEYDFPFDVDVVTEPKRGLASVRNRLLEEAQARDASVLLGLDDDETASAEWVRAYEAALDQLPHCDVLMGWVEFVFDGERSPWVIPPDYGRRLLGQMPGVLATTNFAMRKFVFCSTDGLGHRFDARFNQSGGEDSDFFIRLLRYHETFIGAVPKAKTTEHIPSERGTVRHMVLRCWNEHLVYYAIRAKGRSGHMTIKSVRLGCRLSLLFLKEALGACILAGARSSSSSRGIRGNLGKALHQFTASAAFVGFLLGWDSTYYGAGDHGGDDHVG